MTRAVYIGGFGNGRLAGERVANTLVSERGYDDVDLFTFAGGMDNPDKLAKAVRGADVYTHSGGMVTLADTRPAYIEAYGAPLPTPIHTLVGRTAVKTVLMHTPGRGIRSFEDALAVGLYDTSCIGEYISHPRGNFGRLGEISGFNGITSAIDAVKFGITVSLVYNDGDEYFSPPYDESMVAINNGVRFAHIPGAHDDLVIRPAQTLERASAALALQQ